MQRAAAAANPIVRPAAGSGIAVPSPVMLLLSTRPPT
jgi:hypothetical protein